MNMPAEQMPQEQEMLDEGEEEDIDTAIEACLEIFDNPEGAEQLQMAADSPSPEKAIGLFLSNVVETVMTGPGGDEISPRVWFATGGVFDDMAEKLSELAGMDLTELMPAIKEHTMESIKKRGVQLQGGQAGQQPMQPESPQEPMAPERPPLLAVS